MSVFPQKNGTEHNDPIRSERKFALELRLLSEHIEEALLHFFQLRIHAEVYRPKFGLQKTIARFKRGVFHNGDGVFKDCDAKCSRQRFASSGRIRMDAAAPSRNCPSAI